MPGRLSVSPALLPPHTLTPSHPHTLPPSQVQHLKIEKMQAVSAIEKIWRQRLDDDTRRLRDEMDVSLESGEAAALVPSLHTHTHSHTHTGPPWTVRSQRGGGRQAALRQHRQRTKDLGAHQGPLFSPLRHTPRHPTLAPPGTGRDRASHLRPTHSLTPPPPHTSPPPGPDREHEQREVQCLNYKLLFGVNH